MIQRHLMPRLATLFITVLVTGCGNPPESALAVPAALASDVPGRSQALDFPHIPASAWPGDATANTDLEAGMPYAELRRVVLAGGWTPVVDPECRANVVGAHFEALCAVDPTACAMCERLPELASCSGDGHCLMQFKLGEERLTVSTYGDLSDWSINGAGSRLTVKWWDAGAINATPASGQRHPIDPHKERVP